MCYLALLPHKLCLKNSNPFYLGAREMRADWWTVLKAHVSGCQPKQQRADRQQRSDPVSKGEAAEWRCVEWVQLLWQTRSSIFTSGVASGCCLPLRYPRVFFFRASLLLTLNLPIPKCIQFPTVCVLIVLPNFFPYCSSGNHGITTQLL